LQVRDIMTQPVRTIDVFATAQEAAATMARYGIGALPVTENGNLVGIITDRDLTARCLASGHAPELIPVRVIMTAHPLSVSPTDTVDEAARTMGDHAIRRLPVMDRGKPVGMISADDIARFCADDELVSEMMRHIARHTAPPAVHESPSYALAQRIEYVDG